MDPHNLLGTEHDDTTSDDPTQGSIIYGNSSNLWDELVLGSSKTHLESDGTDISWEANITMADTTTIGLGGAIGRLLFRDASPDSLDVRKANLRVRGAGATTTPYIYLDSYCDTSTYCGTLFFRKSAIDQLDSDLSTVDSHVLGHIQFAGNDGSDFDWGGTIQIRQEGDLDGVGTYIPSEIWFQAASTQSYQHDAEFGITKTGCFGVGYSNPEHHIDLFRDTDDPCGYGLDDVMIRLRNGVSPIALSKSWLFGIWDALNQFIIRDDIENSIPFRIEEDAPTDSLRIQGDGDIYFGAGKVGIGESSPEGYFHEIGDYSGVLHWEYSGLDGTSQTIISVNGCGAIVDSVYASALVAEITGGVAHGEPCWLKPGDSVDIYDDGTDIVTLSVAWDGSSVSVQRTAGSDTFIVSLWLMWM